MPAFLTHLKNQTKELLHVGISDCLNFSLTLIYSSKQELKLDALSRSPVEEVNTLYVEVTDEPDDALIKVQNDQRKDEELMRIFTYLQDKIIPEDSKQAMQVVNLIKKGCYIVDGILYYKSSDVPD